MKAFLLVFIATLLASIAQLLYKLGDYWIFLGFAIYCLAGLLIILALRSGELSVIFPLLATSFVWVALLSMYFFSEQLSVLNWLGIALVVLGVSLTGVSK